MKKTPEALGISGMSLALATGGLAGLVYKRDYFSLLRGAKVSGLNVIAQGDPVIKGQRARFDVLARTHSRGLAAISFSLTEDGQPADLSAPMQPAEKSTPNPSFSGASKKDQGRAVNERTLAYHSPQATSEQEADSILGAPLEITGDFSTGYNAPDRVVEYTFLASDHPSQFAISALVKAKKELCLTTQVSLTNGSVIMKETECIQVRSVNK